MIEFHDKHIVGCNYFCVVLYHQYDNFFSTVNRKQKLIVK